MIKQISIKTKFGWISAYEQNNKIYNLIAEIYNVLGNKELCKKLLNLNSRLMTANSLKDELSGIYRKNQ